MQCFLRIVQFCSIIVHQVNLILAKDIILRGDIFKIILSRGLRVQTVYAAGDGHFEENMAFFIGSRRKQFYNGATNSWLDRNYK